MSSSIFNAGKNSQACNYNYKAEYDAFFAKHKGKDEELKALPPFNGNITKRRRKLISDSIQTMRSPDKENDMYASLASALTHFCMAVADNGNHKTCLVFRPNSKSRIRAMPDSNEIELPDFVAFTVARRAAPSAIRSFPKVPSAFELDGLLEDKVKAVVKELVMLGLDHQFLWPAVQWTDEDWVEKLYSCVNIVVQEARRESPQSIPRLYKAIESESKPIGVFKAEVGSSEYCLLPTFCGRGNGRKPFVALGISMNGGNIRVFKYAWYGKTELNRERTLLEKLKDSPGVVRIDTDLSQHVLEDNRTDIPGIDLDEESIRTWTLLVLGTVEFPLCTCESVQEFLEAMYDLLEVLRFTTQERNILHRDISWSNVLIRPKEYHDIVDVRAMIANVKKNQDSRENIPHGYRFISDIFNENEWKVRVALADFDHAVDLEKDGADELKNATGTPMFMAEDVLSVRDGTTMTPFSRFSENVRREVPNDFVDKYSDCQEKHEWDKYYENFAGLRWRIEPQLSNDDKLVQSFRHGAVHDAESVFYLCLLFFNRLWPLDEHVDPSEIPTLEVNRGKLFEIFAGRRCDRNTVRFVFPDRTSFGTGEIFEPFYAMLKTMFSYVRIPWYNVVSTGRGERYEFHLHDFMQRLILKEIRRLRANGDPILIEENPLLVKTSYNLATYSHDAYLSSSLLCSRDESSGRMGYRKDASLVYGRRECLTSRRIFTARVRRTREGKEDDTRNRKRRRNRNDLVNSSSPNTLVLPVDRPKEMPESDKEKLHDPTGTFWDIYWWKARERLWITAER
ncbi:hypothetical protein ACEPAH_1793 [Sanghuangporus vaninii]